MAEVTCEIKMRLPSLNDFIYANRANRYVGAKMKKDVQAEISTFISGLPHFDKPVTIDFLWIEKTGRRDLDNVGFGKKFILDALVERGILTDDSPKYVVGFTDTFEKGKENRVIITIKEVSE
jgi:Holliday junction resolvase RusA-like endonuclease